MKTKYFLINNSRRATEYGIGSYLNQLSVCLTEQFQMYDVNFIIFNSSQTEFTITTKDNGITYYEFPHNSNHDGYSFFKYIIFTLKRYISESENVIFHFNQAQYFYLMCALKSYFKCCKIVYTIHYLEWGFNLFGNVTKLRKVLKNEEEEKELAESIKTNFRKEKKTIAFCDYIIALSKSTYNILINDYHISESKICLIYNGLPKVDCQYNPSDSQTEILYVGRLDAIKGVEYLLKAFRLLVNDYNSLHLTLVGDGDFSYCLSLCQGIWDHVTFTGKIDKTQLPYFFRKATIAVQPSFHEQCSYSAIEMMSYGIPIVGTDSTGLCEMLDYTPYNRIHIDEEHFDPDVFVLQLKNKMEALLNNEALRKKSSHMLTKIFQERYNIDCFASSLNNYLKKIENNEDNYNPDFCIYLDLLFFHYINQRIIFKTDSLGLPSIGCYLWMRIEKLMGNKDIKSIHAITTIQEYLIYYIDWLYDALKNNETIVNGENDFNNLKWLLNKLKATNFCKVRVNKIMSLLYEQKMDINMTVPPYLTDNQIYHIATNYYALN